MAAVLTLRSTYHPRPPGDGSVTLYLQNDGDELLAGFRLALTSVLPLHPRPEGELRLARRVSGYHELALPAGFALEPGMELELAGLVAGHRPRHANDGPASAFVVLADGSTRGVVVVPMTSTDPPEPSLDDVHQPASTHRVTAGDGLDLPLLPWPVEIGYEGGRRAPAHGRLVADGDVQGVWRAVTQLERRLFGEGMLAEDEFAVSVETAATAPGGYRITVDGDTGVVGASDTDGFRHGFVTLAQLLRAGAPERVSIVDAPAYAWRGLHVDLARQFLPAASVARLIDLAAWRKLDRLHLHLTDDEGWRVPIDGYPELTEVGGWRGHGLPIPPLLGSAAAATGGAYTVEEIASWAARGRELGVVLVPEVDLPGHCHAALAAAPWLRDPDDTTGARSVQLFVDNVLYPGRTETDRFVDAVFTSLARLFDSPWLHLGGDEVAPGAWARSPEAARYVEQRGLPGLDAVARSFVADVVSVIRGRTGRRVGAWQEAAEAGGIRPGDGYVVAWKSAADVWTLAEAGHDVVMSPPDAYYLDMAVDDRWESPGASWAGSVSLADTCAFDPGAGWPAATRRHLLGIQACVWTEHIRSEATFDELVFPRLDAIAERAWRGSIAGGPESLERRATNMPRLAESGF